MAKVYSWPPKQAAIDNLPCLRVPNTILHTIPAAMYDRFGAGHRYGDCSVVLEKGIPH